MSVTGCMTAQEYIESNLERSEINNETNISKYVELPMIPIFLWCSEQNPALVHSEYIHSNILQQTEMNNRSNVKRSMEPFFLWYLKRRKNQTRTLDQNLKELTKFQVFKQLYAEWKRLSAEEKQTFLDEYNKQKEQHRRIYPKDYRGYQIKPNPVMNPEKPTVVPLGLQDSVPKSSTQQTNQPH